MGLPPVLFVLSQTGAAADGGIASVSQVIASLRRHRPIIVTDRSTARVEEWQRLGVETHILPQAAHRGVRRAPLQVFKSYGRYAVEVHRIVAASGARVIHANDTAAFQLALAAAKLAPGTRIALNLRDTLDPERKLPTTRYRLLFAAADHVFYLSNDMAARWAQVAPNARRACSVTYSIVDLDRFAPAPPFAGDGPPVALLSGIIRPKKGQLEFIREVSPIIAAEGIATWAAGDFDPAADAYMKKCAEAAEPLGKMVKFLGYRPDVPELMARSAVVAVASHHEGLVRAMIEAMSCARPVVSFDISSARELLEDESGGAGAVVSSGDYRAMADAIIGYCRSPELAAAVGDKGRATAERLFTAPDVVERYERVYDMLEQRA